MSNWPSSIAVCGPASTVITCHFFSLPSSFRKRTWSHSDGMRCLMPRHRLWLVRNRVRGCTAEYSHTRLDHTAIHPKRRTRGCRGKGAANVGHEIRDFFGRGKALDQGTGPDGFEELLFEFGEGLAA